MPVTPYSPRHATLPVRAARAGRADDDDIKAPGLAAMLRRSPHRVRQAAAAAIGAGLVLFVVTSVASAATHPAATAPQAAAPVAPHPAASAASTPAAPAPRHEQVAAPAHQRVAAKDLAAKLVRSKQKAPATKQVISGLAANGIPNVALNAYRVAAARMAHDDPSCGIDWAMLAGIGREESDHGRFAGAVLNADGTSTPRIIGPALDGTHSDYIAAPANGYALDGDAKYTHALGPMQFIPQTWASYGVDANGDGKADIFNINDAALGAARYLCAAGGDLRTQAGRVRAVLAYNHNDQYLAQVLALAQAYRSGLKVTGIPVGNLTGALPPIKAGSVLAVNPGIPTAVGLTGKAANSTQLVAFRRTDQVRQHVGIEVGRSEVARAHQVARPEAGFRFTVAVGLVRANRIWPRVGWQARRQGRLSDAYPDTNPDTVPHLPDRDRRHVRHPVGKHT